MVTFNSHIDTDAPEKLGLSKFIRSEVELNLCKSSKMISNLKRVVLVLVIAVATTSAAKPPKNMFSDKEVMENMVETEKKLFEVLDNYTTHLETRAQKLKTYHEEFKKAYEDASNGIEDYLNNPVNAFLFTRRLLVTWHEVEQVMSGDIGKEWARELKLNRFLKGMSLPSKDDLTYAAQQLKKLQDQYQLSASEMAQGGPYGISLNSGDCFELGREAYEVEDLDHSYDWLQEALLRVEDGRSKEEDIVEYLAAVAYLKGRIRKAFHLTNRLLELSPKHTKAVNNVKYYIKRLEEIEKDKNNALKNDVVVNVINWQEEDLQEFVHKLCEGEVGLRDMVRAKLKCRLAHQDNPYLTLARLKEEDVYLQPRILLYHEVLTESDITAIQSAAEQRMYEHNTEGTIHASVANLPDAVNTAIAAATRRAADLSGLDASYSDMLQILRYDYNGSQRTHYDRQEVSSALVRKAGNKLATIRFFLNDEEGGGAVFPALRLTVKPVRGSALLWHNLRRNGQGDDLTLHGTCPVLSDQHWEANKWIRTFGNEKTYPCGYTKDA